MCCVMNAAGKPFVNSRFCSSIFENVHMLTKLWFPQGKGREGKEKKE